jgi:hypothetical protein
MSSTSTLIDQQRSTSSDYTLTKNEFAKMYSISDRILLTGYKIDPECQQFLDENPYIASAIPEIANLVNKTLNMDIVPTLEVIKDEESLDVRRLSFNFIIKNKSYEEILKLWDFASAQVYQNLNDTIATKIAIVLDGD